MRPLLRLERTFLTRTMLLGSALFLAGLSGAGTFGCRRSSSETQEAAVKLPAPSLRIYALGGAAAAVEPCGCVKDMLGGIDHAAAFVKSQRPKAPFSLVLGAGPMFFEDPKVSAEEKTQALFKADAMASSLRELGLTAWAPGANDFATGEADFRRLAAESAATPLGANVQLGASDLGASRIVKVGGLSVGLLGLSTATPPGGLGGEIRLSDAAESLAREGKKLDSDGAEIKVLLIAAARGEALRLAENAKGFQLVIVGKGYDQGDKNDEAFPPELIGSTLVVQAPNHLQGLSVIDLYVREKNHSFQDGSNLAALAENESRRQRAGELSRRIALWEKPESGVNAADLAKARGELRELNQKISNVKTARVPATGSFFLYEYVEVKESLGQDPPVFGRISAYYERVNEHNRELFKDKLPLAAGVGEKSYVGVETCAKCHSEEHAFWLTTGHGKAYATLSKEHKEFNLDCVSCHVTGYEKPGGSTVTHVEALKDVQCEVCHGPGSAHVDGAGAKAEIRRMPELTLCAESCHHAPHVGPDWNVATALPKILGPGHGR